MPVTLYAKPVFFGDVECPHPSAKAALSASLVGLEGMNDHAILEWLFKITNAPADALSAKEADLIKANKAALSGKIWSLSVGDVIALNGKVYYCDSFGFYEIGKEAARAYFAAPWMDRRYRAFPVPKGFEKHPVAKNGLLSNRKDKDFLLEAKAEAAACV